MLAFLIGIIGSAGGCSGEESGNDIVVPGTGGEGGSKSSGGGKSSSGGKGTVPSSGEGGSLSDGGLSGSGGASGGMAGGASGGMAGSATGGGSAGMSGGDSSGTAGGAGAGGVAGAAGSAGTAGTAGTGGGGIVQCGPMEGVLEPGEECDPPDTAVCSSSCGLVSTDACVECEYEGDCFEFVENCSVYPDADDRELCFDVMRCIQLSNCFDSTGTLGGCYCGDIPPANCSSAPLVGPGSPNGACKDLILEGLMPVETSAQVLGLLTATARPAGGAGARLNCQKIANMTAAGVGACFDVCGFGTADRFPPLPE